MIAVTVSVRMKVTADAITPTATVDNPELSKLYEIYGLLWAPCLQVLWLMYRFN